MNPSISTSPGLEITPLSTDKKEITSGRYAHQRGDSSDSTAKTTASTAKRVLENPAPTAASTANIKAKRTASDIPFITILGRKVASQKSETKTALIKRPTEKIEAVARKKFPLVREGSVAFHYKKRLYTVEFAGPENKIHVMTKRLGSGAYGTVKGFKSLDGAEKSALKTAKHAEDVKVLLGEVLVLRKLQEKKSLWGIQFKPHGIVHLKSDRKGYLMARYRSDYAECIKARLGVTLTQRQKQDRFGETHQLLCALHYLQQEDIVHGDIKPKNILSLKKEGINLAHLADFGSANQLTDRNFLEIPPVTPEYIFAEEYANLIVDLSDGKKRFGSNPNSPHREGGEAPIAVRNGFFSQLLERRHKADVFAMGIVLYESFFEKYPFQKTMIRFPLIPQNEKIFRENAVEAFQGKVSTALIHLICDMLQSDLAERPDGETCFARFSEIFKETYPKTFDKTIQRQQAYEQT